ncbi:MAG: DUF1540 domain-containing protein [Actinobacteria bacterium]|nr:MAG: DUF1540 domain-containing protein [Actinomycetota bacterium]
MFGNRYGRGDNMGKENIVATCHVNDCMWWESDHCNASQIKVDMIENHADCLTYEKEGEL